MANSARYAAMLKYLRQCPALTGILNFQAGNDNTIRVMTVGNDTSGNRKFIDGSVSKVFDFTIEFYKELNNVPYLTDKGELNQNLETLLDVQGLIDWLEEQDANNDLPDFGSDCVVDSVKSLSNEPLLAWIDSASLPLPTAKYTVTVRTEYIDYSRAI